MLVNMNVTNRKEIFTIDSITGKVTGQTYVAREFLKKNFDAKWNAEEKQWTVDVEKFNAEITRYADYYKKYIEDIIETSSNQQHDDTISRLREQFSEFVTPAKKIVDKKLVNGKDGFYSVVTYIDGSTERFFIG